MIRFSVSTSRALWYNGNSDGTALEFQVGVLNAVTGVVTPLTDFSSATEAPGLLLPMSLADDNHVVHVTIVARNTAGCVAVLGDSAQVLLSSPSLLTLAARFSTASASSAGDASVLASSHSASNTSSSGSWMLFVTAR
jgi:hypothetical protein